MDEFEWFISLILTLFMHCIVGLVAGVAVIAIIVVVASMFDVPVCCSGPVAVFIAIWIGKIIFNGIMQ